MANTSSSESWDIERLKEQFEFLTVGIFHYRAMQYRPIVDLMLKHAFQLEEFVKFYENTSISLDAPYHNDYHTKCMVLNCFEGALYERLNFQARLALVVAALFHDYDHSAGGSDDATNIRNAVVGLKEAQSYALNPLLPSTLNEAINLIHVTQYPYVREPKTITEQIIRDADLMQSYEEDRDVLRRQFLGLKQEIEVARGVKYTNAEFATGQLQWSTDNVVWHTNWARQKAAVRNWDETQRTLYAVLSQRE